MRYLIYIIITIAIALTASCGRGTTDVEAVAKAERTYADGDFAAAQTLCDSLTTATRIGSLSTDNLCRITLLYARIAESGINDAENMASATRCLLAARSVSADSVNDYIASLPVNDRATLAMVVQLCRAIECRADSTTVFDEHDAAADSVEFIKPDKQ